VGQRRSRSRWIRYLVLGLILAIFGTIVWVERTSILQGAADLWVVSDPITHGDAAVVLGGGADVRPFVAADLYAKGLVRKILVSRVEDTPTSKLGVQLNHTEFNVKILEKLGVPDSAIELFGDGSQNTWEEALALREWTKQHATSALIVPTEVFFARRARWVFQRTFSGTGVRVEVPSFDPPNGYHRKNWWKTEGGVVTFQNEILKYFYYRLKY
jgi:uncharacterized SAM-binding protein YcdF (DUF218 family)